MLSLLGNIFSGGILSYIKWGLSLLAVVGVVTAVYLGYHYVKAKDEQIAQLMQANQILTANVQKLLLANQQSQVAIKDLDEELANNQKIAQSLIDVDNNLQNQANKESSNLQRADLNGLRTSKHADLVLRKLNVGFNKLFDSYSNTSGGAVGAPAHLSNPSNPSAASPIKP